MPEYDNTNRGVLFKNLDKTPENKQPDFSGSLNINGSDDWRLAAWIQTSKTGNSYLSLKLSLKKHDQLDKDIKGHQEKWQKPKTVPGEPKPAPKDIPF